MAYAIVLGEIAVGYGETEAQAWEHAREEARKIGAEGAHEEGTLVECSAYCATVGDGHFSVLWHDDDGVMRHTDERYAEE